MSPLSSHSYAGVKVGVPEYGNLPNYGPRYPGMAASVWKPTSPVQPSSFWDRLLNLQVAPSSSQIHIYP